MSGHSKWSTIKRKKGAADAKRGKIFTRCIHEISVAVREGKSTDPASNARLRIAIEKAKDANMPNDTIDRAVKRAGGEGKDVVQEEVVYEGYGPGGVAVLVEVLTDNRNRTVGEVRNAFTKCGGALGETGCVSWMFSKKGLFAVKRDKVEEEQIMDIALEAGAEDVSDGGEVWEIVCDLPVFSQVRAALEKANLPCEVAEVQFLPQSRVTVQGKEAEQVTRMIEMLDELDDVMNVSANCDFS